MSEEFKIDVGVNEDSARRAGEAVADASGKSDNAAARALRDAADKAAKSLQDAGEKVAKAFTEAAKGGRGGGRRMKLDAKSLADEFGIDLEDEPTAGPPIREVLRNLTRPVAPTGPGWSFTRRRRGSPFLRAGGIGSTLDWLAGGSGGAGRPPAGFIASGAPDDDPADRMATAARGASAAPPPLPPIPPPLPPGQSAGATGLWNLIGGRGGFGHLMTARALRGLGVGGYGTYQMTGNLWARGGGGLGALFGGGGAGAAGAGGAAGGVAGAAGGPIGLALTMAAENILEGGKTLFRGAATFAKSVTTGNASQAMHGIVSGAQGYARLGGGPIVGPMLAKLVGVGHALIDTLDGLVQNLGKYNVQTALASAKLEAMTTIYQVRLSRVMEPAMTAWVNIKMKFLRVMDQIAQLLAPAAKVFGLLLDGLGKIVDGVAWVNDKLMSGFKGLVASIRWAIEKIRHPVTGRSWKDIKKDVDKEFDGGGLDAAAKKFNDQFFASLGAGRSASGGSARFNPGVGRFAMPNGRGGRGGRGRWVPSGNPDPHVPTGINNGLQLPASVAIAWANSPNAHKYDWIGQHGRKTIQSEVSASRTTYGGGVARDAAMAAGQRLNEELGELAARFGSRHEIDRATYERLVQEAHARNRAARSGNPAPSTSVGGTKITGPSGAANFPPRVNMPAIIQNVKFDLNMKLAHEREVHEAIFQVRDKLFRGLATARDETRLLGAMMDVGLAPFM